MATSTTGALVQTILGLRQLEIQQQAQDLAIRQQGAAEQQMGSQMMAGLTDLIKATARPEDILNVLPQIAQKYNAPPEVVEMLARNLVPSVQTQMAGDLQTERKSGGITSRETGLAAIQSTPMQQAQTRDYTALGEEDRQKMLLISGGLQLSEAQRLGLEKDWAGLRLQDRELVERSALQAGQLRMEGERLRIAATQGKAAGDQAAAEQAGQQQKIYNDTLKNYTDLMTEIVRKGPTMSKAGLRANLSSLNLYMSQIIGMIGPEAARKAGMQAFDVEEALSSDDIVDFLRAR